MTRTTVVIAAALALAVTLPAASAQAQSIRTFVSTAGTDNATCSLTAPCRHFSAAVAATSLGGEVDALDAGAYGSFIITQAITIEGQGWSYVAPGANGNAITVNAGSGDVKISGLSLNGVGASGGTNGIVFNSGASLTVTDCVAQNFAYGGTGNTTGNGILMHPASGAFSFVISNTIASNNGFVGVYYASPSGGSAVAKGVIDHVTTTNNEGGIAIYTNGAGGSTTVAISNSVASNNSVEGIFIEDNGTGTVSSPNVMASIDNTAISGNVTGIDASFTSKVLLGRSAITGNGTGISGSASFFFTYKDNRINGNGTDIGAGSQLTTDGLQ